MCIRDSTKELALRANKVVAIEVDQRLPPLLAETLAEFDNVEILLQDVLKVDLAGLIREKFAGMPVAVCANLPYYITSPILMRLLEEKLPIQPVSYTHLHSGVGVGKHHIQIRQIPSPPFLNLRKSLSFQTGAPARQIPRAHQARLVAQLRRNQPAAPETEL